MSKMAEFEKIRDLFTVWVKNGVPKGVAYPRTQTEAVGWKCEEFGVSEGIGSKAYFKSTHPEYGAIVKEIAALAPRLKPEEEVRKLAHHTTRVEVAPTLPKGRPYKTQKAKRRAAEDLSESLQADNIGILKQLQEARNELAAVKLSLAVERQDGNRLRREKSQLEADNARLTRLLATKNGLLSVVE
ncbi:hypothetical protein HFO27_23465 [Rhizobium leguminosarum]|uniref:hypothetical protein n=1 Tax=Rhizobium leguminosarum TaxID=384 RepID=UPI001C919E9D|nr:hypothetical protein [Rhizobium leguminosarum]MBY3177563.1 hypothetical protein [Rhizobium leguminosarum]